MNWIYGDNVDTDVIIPARYLNTKDSLELAMHCMEDIDKNFSKEVQPNDLIKYDKNYTTKTRSSSTRFASARPLRRVADDKRSSSTFGIIEAVYLSATKI